MFTLVIFITALVLIVFSLIMKSIEMKRGEKIFLASLFAKSDIYILKSIHSLKFWWSHVNFKNTKLIFSWIIASIRRVVTAFKRRFDHKHHPFFTKREHVNAKNKGAVSFFLKNISEHKKSLRDK